MKLRCVTYNIHRAIGVDRRFRPNRIVKILGDHDSDVVLLQEVDEGAPRSWGVDLTRELARSLGYSHYAVGHNVSLSKGRYGNATLSRYPILRERNIDLTVGQKKRRGCQHTTIEIVRRKRPSHRIEVFNVHLGLSARERQIQAGMLARSGELSQLDPEVPCLLGGDFNDWRSLLRAFFVEALGFRCATDRMTKKGVRAIRTYPSFSPRTGFDRIYYRGSIRSLSAWRCRHREAKVASDHLPIIAEFELH